MKTELAEKTVLIVGGGTGMGAGIALAMAEAGCSVAIAGRRESKLQETAANWQGEPAIRYRSADVGDRQSILDLVTWAESELGRIDIFVNAAGINVPKRSMAEMAPEDWDKVMRVNATGAYNCLHAVLPGMRGRSDGLIVNISSVAGKRGFELGGIAYGASKHAMSALGLLAGIEESQHGIRITNIYPGEVNTPLLDQRPAPPPAEKRAQMVQPEDLGDLVVAIAKLPPRAHVPEVVIAPLYQPWAG